MKALFLALAVSIVSCSCRVPPVEAPQFESDAADSTYRVQVVTPDGIGSGTAWVAKRDEFGSTLITAGHVCQDAVSMTLEDRAGNEHVLSTFIQHPIYDLCALISIEDLGPPLTISPLDPEYDEPVIYVGAPRGVYGCEDTLSGRYCGIAPIYRGVFAGGNMVTNPAAPGASGSALRTSRGVIGVLTSVVMSFNHETFFETRAHLVEFLDSI